VVALADLLEFTVVIVLPSGEIRSRAVATTSPSIFWISS
jgi:hypothetical protein